ncbi:MAG: WYL domain-containing protein [Patescibacteria group bacterium]|jgi:predicted DNA-binding transcriptional regulator YafY
MYPIIETIKQAAREKKVLKIIYREKDGTSEGWRYVEPYSFSHDNGEDGFFAWDASKGGIRRFSIDRINDAQVTDETYNPRYGIEI